MSRQLRKRKCENARCEVHSCAACDRPRGGPCVTIAAGVLGATEVRSAAYVKSMETKSDEMIALLKDIRDQLLQKGR